MDRELCPNQNSKPKIKRNSNNRKQLGSSNPLQGFHMESGQDSNPSNESDNIELEDSNIMDMLNKQIGGSPGRSKLLKHLESFQNPHTGEPGVLPDVNLLEDDSMSGAEAVEQTNSNSKMKKGLISLITQIRYSNGDEDLQSSKVISETKKLGEMALLRALRKEVEVLLNYKLFNDFQKDTGTGKQAQSEVMRSLLKNIHQQSEESGGLDALEEISGSGNLDQFEILNSQAKDFPKPKKRYDVDNKDESEVQSASDSHFTSIAGPPPIYEEVMQNLEADIRKHIRIEHQLKLHIESVEDRVEELEREQEQTQAQIADLKKHKIMYINIKKELASKEEVLDVKQILLQKQKKEIEEAQKSITRLESEGLELKNAVKSLQIEKINLLKQVKQNQINKYNELIHAQNNPYNSFLEDTQMSSMIQLASTKQSGQPSALSNQSQASDKSSKNQNITSGNISLIQQNMAKKSHDQLSLIEHNKALGLGLQAKTTSSTRNTQIYNNTSSQLGFMSTSQVDGQNRIPSQNRNQNFINQHKPNALIASYQSIQNINKCKQNNKSVTVGSNRMKQEKTSKSGGNGNGSQRQTPNGNENMFYSQSIHKNQKLKQKHVNIDKLSGSTGPQQMNNTATTHSALNLTSGLLGPQLQLNMTNPIQQISQIYSLQGHSEDYKKSRTPDKVKLKSKTKLAKKELTAAPAQISEFTVSKQGLSHVQNLQGGGSRSQSQQAQYAQIPERLFTAGRGGQWSGHMQNQSNTIQKFEGGPQEYHVSSIKANAVVIQQPKNSHSMNTAGAIGNQQQQKLTSKAKLQNIYSNNQNRKQQFRNNKNQIQSQERQFQQLVSSAASNGSQGQQRIATGVTRNGGLNTYNTVSAANIGEQHQQQNKLGEQKRQVMHNQWILTQETEKNSKQNKIQNQEIKAVLKTGLDNSSTGAADSSSIKALQRRCSSQLQNPTSEDTGNKVTGQPVDPNNDLDYSRAILNVSQPSTDKGKSSKISQSSLNNTQKLKSSSRKGGSAKRQAQPKLKKEEQLPPESLYGNAQANVGFQNRIIPSRDTNSSSMLGKVTDDSTNQQMQKQKLNIQKGQ